jgi:hypothetical protein
MTYFEPSDHDTTPFMFVQVPDVSGAQQPARKGTMQLVKSGLVGSEQTPPLSTRVALSLPLSAPTELSLPTPLSAPAALSDPIPLSACVPLSSAPVPEDEDEEQAVHAAVTVASAKKNERDIESPLFWRFASR